MTNLPALPPAAAGQLANQLAAASAFRDYKFRKSPNTLNQQLRSLSLFARSLLAFDAAARGVKPAGDMIEAREMTAQLFTDPRAWMHITHGQVKAFEGWMLSNGYATGSINVALSHVRVYAQLAWKAGALPEHEARLIAAHANIQSKEAGNIDQHRDVRRIGAKKEHFNVLDDEQIAAMLSQPATPKGRRNAVILSTLLYFGLRAGELAALTVADVDMAGKRIHVTREKVKGTKHEHAVYSMAGYPLLLGAYMAYMAIDAPTEKSRRLLLGAMSNNKDSALSDRPMSRVTISQLVRQEGRRIGVMNLSAHDLRHTGATKIAQDKDVIALRDWGGWSNINMPARYVERNSIANDAISAWREDS
jgi:integrase